jgi:protein-S-isoprenylcysteine O-methyltransferase Ste14
MMQKLATSIAVIVGGLAYLGLAVLGWGGFAAFFAHPARTALAVVGFVLAGAALFSSGNLSRGEREDRSNRWVIAVLGVLGLLDGYLPAYTDRTDFWTLDGDAVRWLGVALFAAGGALRIWPVFVLGKRFSGLVAIQPGHELVTTGIYGAIRHPSYLGLLVNALGWALAFRSGIGVLIAALMIPGSTRRKHRAALRPGVDFPRAPITASASSRLLDCRSQCQLLIFRSPGAGVSRPLSTRSIAAAAAIRLRPTNCEIQSDQWRWLNHSLRRTMELTIPRLEVHSCSAVA